MSKKDLCLVRMVFLVAKLFPSAFTLAKIKGIGDEI
jgi:hypothetical protein